MKRVRAIALATVAASVLACGDPSMGAPPAVPPPPPPIPEGAIPPEPAQTLPQEVPPPPPYGTPPEATSTTTTTAATPGQPPPEVQAPPPAVQWTATYPTGQWVYANGYGWVWVPKDAGSVVVDEVPYVYLYTPTYGWTWYVSPWGFGPYRYGGWVRHPWHPVGWRGGFVARPHVVVRIGHGYHGYGHGGYRVAPHHGGGHRR